MATATIPRCNSNEHNDGVWPEFAQDVCEELNNKRCLGLVASPSMAAAVCRYVDEVCAKLGDANDVAVKYGTDTKTNDVLLSLQRAPRVCFTTEANIAKLQKCIAVYGRIPILVVLEMYDDRSFVLDLDRGVPDTEKLTAAIELFLRGVAEGGIAKALQGAAPPEGDKFVSSHNVTLNHGLCAVTSTLQRLKRKEPGGAICVFWSARCAICPAVLMMIDHIVGIVWKASESCGVVRPFSYLACNVDDNDFPVEDWPETPDQQVIPTMAAYNGNGERFVYSDKRSAAPFVSFMCTHCLPKDLPSAAQITSVALAIAEEVTDEKLWEVGLPSAASKVTEKKIELHGDTHEMSAGNSRGIGRKRPPSCSETLAHGKHPQGEEERQEEKKNKKRE
ncbi:hypothetical protein TraAM80_01620 [Trypanosoma rangeli]|uniref:Thioredoxin domain-containing protein n=1 Tax=Trypanosoma rangeli TaxID=5698 RepID=A0A3R7KM92_TRYRA|nr:uncharacterized protein TraAM80_01620 [Trypanosoma rangeli]RNF10277.1 hypothetical protein TraAM80_01620 [Trypanosoma rangeli]|eukprot:RNF10277.1 hypothetical protein TraAM80_01620 [Trypanosoma rangeli]